MVVSNQELKTRFGFTAPDLERAQLGEQVRQECLNLATTLNRVLPAGREFDEALARLDEVMFWANAALARRSKDGS